MAQLKTTLFLLDIDGTLVDCHGAGKTAMERAGKQLFGNSFDLSDAPFGGNLDPLLFDYAMSRLDEVNSDKPSPLTENHTSDRQYHQQFHDAYLTELEAELASIPADQIHLPGVAELLDELAQQESSISAVLTGNYTQAAPIKLRSGNIDPDQFAFIVGGEQASDRRALAKVALTTYFEQHSPTAKQQNTQAVVIGDTPRDIDCAHANDCLAIGVATGHCTTEELSAAGADLVLENLTNTQPIWDFLASA